MTDERTIAFVDLAGFNALTEVHGDHATVDLLDVFGRSAATRSRRAAPSSSSPSETPS
jgi:class 3 adenylate cyclase